MNAGLWLTLITNLPHAKPFLPLHYTIYFGIDLSGSWHKALWLPGFGAIVLVFHAIIGLFDEGRRWMRAWSILGLLIQVLLFSATVMLIAQTRLNV